MISWLNIFKHLLPRAEAWSLTADKLLRQFFQGLSSFPQEINLFIDQIYEDLDPKKTRSLVLWESQFALRGTGLNEVERRDRLDAAWKASGGQDPQYIQGILQANGFSVFVHEWWESIPNRPAGGSVDGDVVPVARNPLTFLWNGQGDRVFTGVGHDSAFIGGDSMFIGSEGDPPGYALVNKITESNQSFIGVGHDSAFIGGDSMAVGASITNLRDFNLRQYTIENDPANFPFFLYVGGAVFPETVTIPVRRRNEFEDLCLKICPTEQWLGILVNYT